jgi:hypothetical protein
LYCIELKTDPHLSQKVTYKAKFCPVYKILDDLRGMTGVRLVAGSPIIPLLTALSSAAFSGAVGGLIAYLIIIKLEKTKLLKKSEAKRDEK